MTDARDPDLVRLFAETPEPEGGEAFVEAVGARVAGARRAKMLRMLAITAATVLAGVTLAGPLLQAGLQLAAAFSTVFDAPGGELAAMTLAGTIALFAVVLSRVRA